jgi:hypothetical protein
MDRGPSIPCALGWGAIHSVTPVTQPADKTAAGFTFYQGYISVVYGLVATEGLGQLGERSGWQFRIPPSLLLFLGVFVIGLHFWFICSTVDESSHKFYRALAGDRRAYILFFVDAMVATSFAWLILAMFHGISSRPRLLFDWFLVAASSSLAYDLYSLILVGVGRSKTYRKEMQPLASSYSTTVKNWLIQDSSFFLGALLIFVLDYHQSWSGPGLDVCFVAVSIVVLALDVKFLPGSTGNSAQAQ